MPPDTQSRSKNVVELDLNKTEEKNSEVDPGIWGVDATFEDSSIPLFKHLLDRETVVLVYGPSNSGKSFLMLDAAVHLAMGKDWGGYKCKEKMAAIVIATEAGKAFGKRVVAARRRAGFKKGDSIQDFPFAYFPVRVDFLNNKDDLLLVRKWISDVEHDTGYKVGMVVIDTMSASFGGGNENSSEDIGKYLNNMIDIKYECEVTPVIVHHSGKDENAGARGHSSLKGNVDTEIRVKSKQRGRKYIRSFTPTKQRDDETDNVMPFGLIVNKLGYDSDGDPITTCNVVFKTDSEFEDVSPSRIDELSFAEKAALKAVHLYEKYELSPDMSELRNRKFSEKQIKVIIMNDIANRNFAVITEEGTIDLIQLAAMAKPARGLALRLERAWDKMIDDENPYIIEKYQISRQGQEQLEQVWNNKNVLAG